MEIVREISWENPCVPPLDVHVTNHIGNCFTGISMKKVVVQQKVRLNQKWRLLQQSLSVLS